MIMLRSALVVWMAVALGVASSEQVVFSDSEAVRQFQRAADAYAFQHRQVQRRLGDSADRQAMANAMRAVRPAPADGDLFTPVTAAAFRHRIAVALKSEGCDVPVFDQQNFAVPRPNGDAAAILDVPACVNMMLPRLPEELAYRAAGITLILVDTHAGLVVDVLHAAFPRPITP